MKPPKIEIFDCEQGSEEWVKARLGIPTASKFSHIMAQGQGKMRAKYLRELAGERITGIQAESFQGPAMERGKVMEDEVRINYSFLHDVKLQRVGFIRNGRFGCSPDSLIGKVGGLEVKTQVPHLLIDALLSGQPTDEHMAQVQGNMWVCEREWWDLAVGYTNMPLFVKKIPRDETFIKRMSDAVNQFADEVDELVLKIKRIGGMK